MNAVDRQARIEDVRWMHDNGECAIGAARRLGIEFSVFEKWARRNVPDLWASMRARDPLPLNPLEAQKVQVQRWALLARRAS